MRQTGSERSRYLFKSVDEFERDEFVAIASGVFQEESIIKDLSIRKVILDLNSKFKLSKRKVKQKKAK